MQKLFLLVSLLALTQSLFAQCPVGQNEVKIVINTDEYWYEAHWTIKNIEDGLVYVTGSVPDDQEHTYTYCIPDDGCKEFSITDDYGDGMEPDGYYRLYLNDVLIRENIGGAYFSGESVDFGCPPGTSCQSAITIDTGAWATQNGHQAWYRFVPQDTGTYQINTCDSLNSCGSKIWVYSTCQNILVSDNQAGAEFYADGGCINGAIATLFLAGGKEYFIRMRYEPANCDTTPIHFTLSYQGPIVGCTDPNSCNYSPLATVSSDCIYPGDPACPSAPDFVTRQDIFRSSMYLNTIDNPDACAVEEGCIRGLGTRHLLNFTTEIDNIGDQDYYIGPPPNSITEPSDQFVWDPCHNHWHYMGYAQYILFDASGYRLPIGSKTGFCVLDLVCPPEDSKYNCINMGITAGCADIYDAQLPCQWVDITDIPAGDYTLVMRVNWDKSPDRVGRVERDYNNNWAQACFNLSYTGSIPEVVYHNDQCPPFTDCAGEKFGSAQPDCNGVCNGPSLHGDWNQDSLRDDTDTKAYLAAVNAGTGDASPCLDLDGNGSLNVYDAALLQQCALHKDDAQYWVQAFPCQFPAGFYNLQDLVTLRPGTLDTVAKTFDIQIMNPINKIVGFEFSVSGINISTIENLSAGYNPDLRFNASTGKILGLGLDESLINKNAMPTDFLRIHYSAITGTEVCLADITAVVNSKYQRSNTTLGMPNCIPVATSAVSSLAFIPFKVFVQPNPFLEKTTVYFDNEAAEPMVITLKDVTGKTLRTFEGIRGNSVTIERNNLPQGTYFFSVAGSKGRVSGKIIAQ